MINLEYPVEEVKINRIDIYEKIIAEIQSVYKATPKDTSWMVGYSGGKDSTVLLHLVWKAVERLKDQSTFVNVVCNDTLVENPLITDYVNESIENINKIAKETGLPFKATITNPKTSKTFWVSLIGKGYPAPTTFSRWCTIMLKIQPSTEFLKEQKTIVVLGTRKAESEKRKKNMEKHFAKTDSLLTPHMSNKLHKVYSPIRDLKLGEVWYVLNQWKTPWLKDQGILYKIYADASADDYECPTIPTDRSHSSCGKSRFGCWVCPVISKNTSLTSQITQGHTELQPLLDFRNKLVEDKNKPENRLPYGRRGFIAKRRDGTNCGSYSFEYRERLLNDLLALEVKTGRKLISKAEIKLIKEIWADDKANPPELRPNKNEARWQEELDELPLSKALGLKI